MFHHFERFLTEYESRFAPEGKAGYRHGRNGSELERMDYPEFIARVVSHIPNKGQVMVRYYGLYANALGARSGRRARRLRRCGLSRRS